MTHTTMMTKTTMLAAIVLVAGVTCAVAQQNATADQATVTINRGDMPTVTTVTVKGLGLDKESALNDALRRAIEQSGYLKVYSESQAENYELIHDTVLTQASGLVREYKILKHGSDPVGGYYVEIKAVVDSEPIDVTWAQVAILLKRLGTPKIMVTFVERIYDNTVMDLRRDTKEEGSPHEWKDHVSLLANKIEQLLLDVGFKLVDKSQFDELTRQKMAEASGKNDMKVLRQIAATHGAQMVITGNARASGPDVTDAYGVTLYMWETDVTLRAFWTETAAMLFTDSLVGSRSGSRVMGPPGAKKAIEKSGEQLAQQCLQNILTKWTQVAQSGGTVVLEVTDIALPQALKLQKCLEKITQVKDIKRTWVKPNVSFEMQTTLSAEKMLEVLFGMDCPGVELEFQDQTFNKITATIPGNSAD